MTRYFILAFLFVLFSFSYSFAFRCGLDLVTTGYTKKQVRDACGKPSFTEKVCADDEYFIVPQKKINLRNAKRK